MCMTNDKDKKTARGRLFENNDLCLRTHVSIFFGQNRIYLKELTSKLDDSKQRMLKDVEAAISDRKLKQMEFESKERQREHVKELAELKKTHRNHLDKHDFEVRVQMQSVTESRRLADNEHSKQLQRLSEDVTRDEILLKSEWEGRLKSENIKHNKKVQGHIKDAQSLKTKACEEHRNQLHCIRQVITAAEEACCKELEVNRKTRDKIENEAQTVWNAADEKRNDIFKVHKDVISGIHDEAERVKERVRARKQRQEEKICLIS